MSDRQAHRLARIARHRKRRAAKRTTAKAQWRITILGHTYRRSPRPVTPPTPAMQRLLGEAPTTIDETIAVVPGLIDLVAAHLIPADPATPAPREMLRDAWEGQRLSLERLLALHRAIAPSTAARRP